MTLYLDYTPVDQRILDQTGTDLASAVAGRVPLDQHDCQLLLRRVDVRKGWREIYDGPAPEIGYEPDEPRPRLLRFAAPEGTGWKTLTFQQQTDGSFSSLLAPGPIEISEEE